MMQSQLGHMLRVLRGNGDRTHLTSLGLANETCRIGDGRAVVGETKTLASKRTREIEGRVASGFENACQGGTRRRDEHVGVRRYPRGPVRGRGSRCDLHDFVYEGGRSRAEERVGEGRRLEEKTGEVRPPRQSTAVLWRNPALTGIVGGQLTDLR